MREPGAIARAVILEGEGNQERLDAVMDLLDAGSDLVDATGVGELYDVRALMVAQATRAVHSFEAVIAACMIGRGAQGAMLNRALYDDVLDIHWVAANPDEAPARADQHQRMISLAEHQLEAKFERTDRGLNDEEAAELAELIEVYGGRGQAFDKAWHRATWAECFALVKERWSDQPDSAGLLDYMYEVEQRRNNLMLHPSPTAFSQTLVVRDGRRTLNRAGPDGRWRMALLYGCGGFYLALRVLAEEFELDREPMAEAFSRSTGLLAE